MISTTRISSGAQRIREAARELKTAQEIYRNAAALFSAQCGHPSLIARLNRSSADIQVTSSCDFDNPRFASDGPTYLMGRALVDKVSIHVPDISGLDKRSVTERISDTGGKKFFDEHRIKVEFIRNELLEAVLYPSRNINSLLPVQFEKQAGALLLTPLGIDQSYTIGLGFMLEYQERGPFSFEAIQEARAYSDLFTELIAERGVLT